MAGKPYSVDIQDGDFWEINGPDYLPGNGVAELTQLRDAITEALNKFNGPSPAVDKDDPHIHRFTHHLCAVPSNVWAWIQLTKKWRCAQCGGLWKSSLIEVWDGQWQHEGWRWVSIN